MKVLKGKRGKREDSVVRLLKECNKYDHKTNGGNSTRCIYMYLQTYQQNCAPHHDCNILYLSTSSTSLINVQHTHKCMSCLELIDPFKQQKKWNAS